MTKSLFNTGLLLFALYQYWIGKEIFSILIVIAHLLVSIRSLLADRFGVSDETKN